MSAVASLKDKQAQYEQTGITVRRMNFEFDEAMPEFWFDNNPFLTLVMTALSVSFPAGEKFFIDSVRHYEKQVKDPLLKQQIRHFIGQEANHTREHNSLNDFMETKGYPARAMADFVARRLKEIQEKSTPEENLARTAALEHFTAILAGSLLAHPEVIETMHPDAARIWAWHAIEEIEHRAVAFDVYKEQVDDEALRRRVMVNVTFLFILINSIRTVILMQRSKNLFNLKAWLKGTNTLWGVPGIFRKVLPQYLDYYRKGFHPNQHDYSRDVKAAMEKYLGEQA